MVNFRVSVVIRPVLPRFYPYPATTIILGVSSFAWIWVKINVANKMLFLWYRTMKWGGDSRTKAQTVCSLIFFLNKLELNKHSTAAERSSIVTDVMYNCYVQLGLCELCIAYYSNKNNTQNNVHQLTEKEQITDEIFFQDITRSRKAYSLTLKQPKFSLDR